MEKILKKVRFVICALIISGFTLGMTSNSEAAIQLVDPSTQRASVEATSNQSSGLERLGSSRAGSKELVIDQGSTTPKLEQLGRSSSRSGEILIDDGRTIDNQFEETVIYISNRITGRKSGYPMKSYQDYKELLDMLDTGTVILITNPIQVSNINKWTSEVSDDFTKNGKGVVVSFSEVSSLSPGEIEKFTAAGVDLSKVKAIEIRKENKNNIIRYDDGKTDLDRGMETFNNVVSAINQIDTLRRRF